MASTNYITQTVAYVRLCSAASALGQAEVCRRTTLTAPTLRLLLAGASAPNHPTIVKIHTGLGIDPAQWFETATAPSGVQLSSEPSAEVLSAMLDDIP